LLAAAERFAQERGAHRIRMSVVNVRTTLIAWYERRGYILTGETQPFPYGDERYGRPLRGDLHFVLLEKNI
jgi:ribosomal protein S18 acetylase RimI-like enzyme